jgi:hypothetical protein
MKVHDEVMPKLNDIYTLKEALKDKIANTPSMADAKKKEIEQTIVQLDSAGENMMVWMRAFNAPPDSPCRIFIDDGDDLRGATIRVEEFPVLDQYTVQGDLFAEAIQTGGPAPTPLEDSVRNMEVIDAIFRSAVSGHWESPTA